MQPLAKKREITAQLWCCGATPGPQDAIAVGVRRQDDLFDVKRRRFPQLLWGLLQAFRRCFDCVRIIRRDAQQQWYAIRQRAVSQLATTCRDRRQVKGGPYRRNVFVR